MANGSPKVRLYAARDRAPKVGRVPPDSFGQSDTPIFCFKFVDEQTGRDWKFKPSANDAKKIVEHLASVGNMSWKEIEALKDANGRHRHHFQAVASIEKKAQRDLVKAKIAEVVGDQLFRFRLGSTRRLWGFRHGRTFHVVWWDPDHQVYPTEPHNT